MTENLAQQLARLPELFAAHVLLTLIALTVGVAISLPLGVVVARCSAARWPVLTGVGVIQTIPSIALLALMVPLLYWMPGVSSLGFAPAIIALTLYSILPILRNTYTGITGVDPHLLEAARGIGMTPAQTLREVELPLAMPVIIAGLRTATVWVVGIATLSVPVGQRSLGTYIFEGLALQNWTAVVVGCVTAAALAMLLDALVASLEVAAAQRSRRRATATAAALALVFTAGLTAPYIAQAASPHPTAVAVDPDPADSDAGGAAVPRRVVRIGAKDFVEQYILAQLLADTLSEAGYDIELVDNLGSGLIFNALAQNEIDVYVEYTGTLWLTQMNQSDFPEPWKVHNIVAGWLASEHGIQLAATLGFENTYALAMPRHRAEALGIRSIDDLIEHAPTMRIGSTTEFFGRPEWHQLRDTYGLNFAATDSFDATFMYGAAARGEVDVIAAFSTDGRIAAYDLLVLEDSRRVFPPYDAIVLLGPAAAGDPQIAAALQPLHHSITADRMRHANQLVDVEDQPVSAAAQQLRR